GITFKADPAYGSRGEFAYTGVDHRLLAGLAGQRLGDAAMPWGIYAASPAWQELAYSVVAATEYAQFSRPVDTLGPRWTSLMDPVRVPVMLARDYGSGSVVLAQLG